VSYTTAAEMTGFKYSKHLKTFQKHGAYSKIVGIKLLNFHINNYREDYSQIRNEMCSNNYEIMLTPNNVTNISENN